MEVASTLTSVDKIIDFSMSHCFSMVEESRLGKNDRKGKLEVYTLSRHGGRTV